MAQQLIKPKIFMNSELVSRLVAGNSTFATDLYAELCNSGSGNIFFSPISISLALAMSYLGAGGSTATEMKDTLKLSALTDEDIHQAYQDLNRVLQTDDQAYILKTANRLFARKSYMFLNDFLDATRKFYNAEAQVLDFEGDAEGARVTINKWVEEQTAKKIQDLLPSGTVDRNTAMVLVNAIYFKGDWLDKFDTKNTKTDKFKLSTGNTTEVQMMFRKEKMQYGMSKPLDCKVVELPYVGKELSMFIILPNKENGLTELEKKITAAKLQELTSQMGEVEVKLTLPRFKLQHQFSVKGMLQALGMRDIFTPGVADLSKMDGTRKLYASDVVHKAFIEVNEEGSEAAAATGMVMMLMCMPIVMEFKADHPFLFLIRENRSKGILFMGRVTDPA